MESRISGEDKQQRRQSSEKCFGGQNMAIKLRTSMWEMLCTHSPMSTLLLASRRHSMISSLFVS